MADTPKDTMKEDAIVCVDYSTDSPGDEKIEVVNLDDKTQDYLDSMCCVDSLVNNNSIQDRFSNEQDLRCSNNPNILDKCSNIPEPTAAKGDCQSDATNNAEESILSDASPKSLLSKAVVTHEKCYDDELDPTLNMCSMFNSPQPYKSVDQQDSNIKETVNSNRDILITDLDSLACDAKMDSECRAESNNDVFNTKETQGDFIDSDDEESSPQIIMLDLQCQDDYVSDYLGEKTATSENVTENANVFESFDTDHDQTSQNTFCYFDEANKEICGDDSLFEHKNDSIISTDLVKDKELYSPQLYLSDNHSDYEQMLTKPDSNEELKHDAILFSETYSMNRSNTQNVIDDDNFTYSFITHNVPTNMHSDSDFCTSTSQCYDFSMNDSGFSDNSHLVMEKRNAPERTPVPEPTNFGTPRPEINHQYSDQIHHSYTDEIMSPPNYKSQRSGFLHSHENISSSESSSTHPHMSPFFFTNNLNPSLANPLLYAQPLPLFNHGGLAYQQTPHVYPDLPNPCLKPPIYPEWKSWNGYNTNRQELSLTASQPSPYFNPHLLQGKYIWHNDIKTESPEVYQKPSTVDNDSEETDDADELNEGITFSNPFPNFLYKTERQWTPYTSSPYAESTTSKSQYGSDNLSPPPSASTPSDTSSVYSPTQMPLPTINPKVSIGNKPGSAFVPYEISCFPKLPYPSMADMMRTSRSSSKTAKHGHIDYASQTGRPRKSQIQSDAISTSTAKQSRFKRKLYPELKTAQDSPKDLSINVGSIAKDEKNLSARRHNEPLKQHAINIMTQWYQQHLHNPYPTKADKLKMAEEGGVTVTQVKSWFANKRNRSNNTKPKVQKKAMEQKLKDLFKDITCNPSIPLADNSQIIQRLTGIIQTCHNKKTLNNS